MNQQVPGTNFSQLSFNMLPHNLEAEQAVLGALLYNNLLYEKVAFLEKDHFFNPIHREIFVAIINMIERGLLVTPITIACIVIKIV